MQDDELKIENVAGLLHAPGADYVFGKYVMIGPRQELIFERAIEEGYNAGVQAHSRRFLESDEAELRPLTDKEFTALIDGLIPCDLKPAAVELWRAYFIVGWTCVALCIVPLNKG